MIKHLVSNNLISFGFHFCISIIVMIFIGLIYNTLLSRFLIIGDVLIAIVPILLYICAGFRFKPTDNIFSDFFSFMLIGLVGTLLWIYAYNETHDLTNTYNPNNPVPWWIYGFYYTGMEPIHLLFDKLTGLDYRSIYGIVTLSYNIIPTSLLFFGIEIRRMYEKKKAKII